jgi:hypothetical protein
MHRGAMQSILDGGESPGPSDDTLREVASMRTGLKRKRRGKPRRELAQAV